MVECPTCKKELNEFKKAWKYSHFSVKSYACDCGTDFREYRKEGKHSFILKKKKKGKGLEKA